MTTTKLPLVAVVVLNWNGWNNTAVCLHALHRADYGRYQILVVDNGSTDGSEAHLRQEIPGLELLQTGANLGYAGGMNAGIRWALAQRADYVWLLNNDTVPYREALTELIVAAEADPKCAALSSRGAEIDASGKNCKVYATAYIGEPRHSVLICAGCSGAAERPYHRADSISGGSLLFRVKALEEVGLLDECYFHYAEEQDLVFRLCRAGWRVGLACRSIVPHARGAALRRQTPQGRYYALRNRFLYLHKLHGIHPLKEIVRHPGLVFRSTCSGLMVRKYGMKMLFAGILAMIDAARGRCGQRTLGPGYQRKYAGD